MNQKIDEQVFKDLLLYCYSSFEEGNFVDGMTLGILLAQDYSKFDQCISMMKSFNKYISKSDRTCEYLVSHYARYIEYMMSKVCNNISKIDGKCVSKDCYTQTEENCLIQIKLEDTKKEDLLKSNNFKENDILQGKKYGDCKLKTQKLFEESKDCKFNKKLVEVHEKQHFEDDNKSDAIIKSVKNNYKNNALSKNIKPLFGSKPRSYTKQKNSRLRTDFLDNMDESQDDNDSDENFDLIVTDLSQKDRICSICQKISDNLISESTCSHKYHKACFERKIQIRLKMANLFEKCPVPKCGYKIERSDICKYLSGYDLLVYDSLCMISELSACAKYITYWCENCRNVFIKKRKKSDKCRECRKPCLKLKKIFEYRRFEKEPENDKQLKCIETYKQALIDVKKQIPKCTICDRWKHKFPKTRAYRCICNKKFE